MNVIASVRRFLQKNENRPKKPEKPSGPVFYKNTFENRNYGIKRHNMHATQYSYSLLNVRFFEDVIVCL